MKKKIVSAVIAAACMIGVSGFTWMEYDRYEPLEEVVTVELGEDISKDPSVYLHANEKALQDTEIDFSGVNLNEAGKYKVTAKSGKKTADFEIMVEDTVAPEVTLAVKEYKTVAGKEISGVDVNTPGEYALKYIIKGDDKETTVEKTVKVTVVTPTQAQSMADAGSTVRTSQGTKSKSAPSSSGSRGSGSGNRSSGSSSSSGSGSSGSGSSGSSNNGSNNNGWTPGQTWEGNKTGEGTIDNYNGNTYEDFTW